MDALESFHCTLDDEDFFSLHLFYLLSTLSLANGLLVLSNRSGAVGDVAAFITIAPGLVVATAAVVWVFWSHLEVV